MSNRKNHNSILVLATLGVYLGLVLVGAAPQVLAQAAMTRQFNVKDEIEVKDDLDNKPDGLTAKAVNDPDLFAGAVADFIQDLNRLSGRKQFSWDQDRHITVEDLSFCESDNGPSYLGSGNISDQARRDFEQTAVNIGREYFRRSAALGIGNYYDGWPLGVSLDLTNNNAGLSLSVKFVTRDTVKAHRFFESMTHDLAYAQGARSSRTIVLENTKSKISDDTILLVIHLPRAGLDELFAASSK